MSDARERMVWGKRTRGTSSSSDMEKSLSTLPLVLPLVMGRPLGLLGPGRGARGWSSSDDMDISADMVQQG